MSCGTHGERWASGAARRWRRLLPVDAIRSRVWRVLTNVTPTDSGRTNSRGMHVRALDPVVHEQVLATTGASFLQTPQWAAVKPDWRGESRGWWGSVDGDGPVGAALVLHRRLPVLGRTLAYLPEGPALPWDDPRFEAADWLSDWIDPLVDGLSQGGAFAVRIGPPVPLREWSAATVKRGLADPAISRFADLPPDVIHPQGVVLTSALRRAGWRPVDEGEGFGSGQPRYVVQIPLAGRSIDDLRVGLNQQWRRNIAVAASAGVTVREAGAEEVGRFHDLYVETARRDGFTPRPRSYLDGLFAALAQGPARARLHLAEREGVLAAAALVITVGRHAWYVYGASSSAHRKLRASNAVQWQAMRRAHADGCAVYDLRGVGASLDPEVKISGLQRFKAGLGGRTVEYVGEWELPLNRPLYRLYQARTRR